MARQGQRVPRAVRVVHFSDFHWNFERLPEADLYVCTGDMLGNYPVIKRSTRRSFDNWTSRDLDWSISPRRELQMQVGAIRGLVAAGGFRRFLRSPDAPIACVRGNHDFVDLALLFEGCGPVTELVRNELVEVAGLRITGHRGIPWIEGTWSDEVSRADLLDRARAMPRADLYLTHYPPSGLGIDGVGTSHYGLDGLAAHIVYELHGDGSPALHCSGHIHECGGAHALADRVLFSNAACAWSLIEGDPQHGWLVVDGGKIL